jgi:hypothetical protein
VIVHAAVKPGFQTKHNTTRYSPKEFFHFDHQEEEGKGIRIVTFGMHFC